MLRQEHGVPTPIMQTVLIGVEVAFDFPFECEVLIGYPFDVPFDNAIASTRSLLTREGRLENIILGLISTLGLDVLMAEYLKADQRMSPLLLAEADHVSNGLAQSDGLYVPGR